MDKENNKKHHIIDFLIDKINIKINYNFEFLKDVFECDLEYMKKEFVDPKNKEKIKNFKFTKIYCDEYTLKKDYIIEHIKETTDLILKCEKLKLLQYEQYKKLKN